MTILNKSKFTGRWSTLIHTSLHKSDCPRSREMSARRHLIFWALSSLLGVKMFLISFVHHFVCKGQKKVETLCLMKGLYITFRMIWFNKDFGFTNWWTCSVTKWVYRITLYGCFQKLGVFPPKWMVKIMVHPIKMDDLGGNPLFSETSHGIRSAGIRSPIFPVPDSGPPGAHWHRLSSVES